MAYVDPDYPSKKAFREAINGSIRCQRCGKPAEDATALHGTPLHPFKPGELARPETYNPSGMFPTTQNGTDVIEGPHYPQPHRWYAKVRVEDGRVVKVIT